MIAIERLSGMSLSGVWRVRFGAGSLIVKSSPSSFESRFYEGVAPALRRAGVPIPALEHVHHEPDSHWLVIEDVAEPLSPSRIADWRPDPRVVAILARLHATTRAQPPSLPGSSDRAWTDAMTEAALGCLANCAADLRAQLAFLQAESEDLIAPWCWISGDPNPRNWDMRADGTPVLFDWELFGPGIPATDLAIIVPGLGDATRYAQVATAYHASWESPEPLPWGVDHLARQIAVAKVATVVQLLHSHLSGAANVGDDLMAWLRAAVPAWVRSIASERHQR